MKTKRISITSLRRKYPHPVRALAGGYGDYCVGGALCRETALGEIDFPNETQLKDAVLRANPRIDWYALPDAQVKEIYSLVAGVTAANNVGEFDLAWKTLGKLLRWRPETTRRNA